MIIMKNTNNNVNKKYAKKVRHDTIYYLNAL